MIAISPEFWVVSVSPELKLELHDTELLRPGLIGACLSAAEELVSRQSSSGRDMQLSW